VRFRATHDGDPGVRIAQALGRDRDNRAVALDDQLAPAPVVVSETRLMGARRARSLIRDRDRLQRPRSTPTSAELAVFGIDEAPRARTLERGRQALGAPRALGWRDDRGNPLAAGILHPPPWARSTSRRRW
jgi:hypothetical protein